MGSGPRSGCTKIILQISVSVVCADHKFDVCVVGHVTQDEIVDADGRSHHGLGGAAYYAATALNSLGARVALVTRLSAQDGQTLRGIFAADAAGLRILDSQVSTRFSNTYRTNSAERLQTVDAVAAPFTDGDIPCLRTRWFHFGPLTSTDMPSTILKVARERGRVSLDVQGYVRQVRNGTVSPMDWTDKETALQHVDILKADRTEAQILTGEPSVRASAARLAAMGPKEVLVTSGADGAVIAARGRLYDVSAIRPESLVDPTGCGDSFCAGYLFARLRSNNFAQAGAFAAAVASCKLSRRGPFTGTIEEIENRLRHC